MIYLMITLVLLVCILLYFRIADYYNIIDKPNSRSSHSRSTIRGGGIVFSLAIIIAYILGYASWPLTLAALIVAVVSFIDDIYPLHQWPRFATHFLAALLIFYEIGLFEFTFWWIPIALFLMVGWINIFNFMDGINGITVLYALVAIISFAMLPIHSSQLELLIIVGLSCIVFGFFNIRKRAKTFAGDVGSVVMALFLGYFMVKTIVITGNPFFIIFFTVYGLDACFTILYRLGRKENIFLPHRTHLYQYLVNELKFPHVNIAFVYALLQLVINLILIYRIDKGQFTYVEGTVFILLSCMAYIFIRRFVTQRAFSYHSNLPSD